MKNQPLTLLGAALLAAFALVAGCGGDDDGDADSASAAGAQPQIATQAEFVRRANALCVESRQQIREKASSAIQESANQAEQDVQLEEFFEEIVAPGLEEEIEGIRALGPPPQGGDQLEAMLAATETTLDEISEDPTAVALEDRLFAESEGLAKDYGVPACGAP